MQVGEVLSEAEVLWAEGVPHLASPAGQEGSQLLPSLANLGRDLSDIAVPMEHALGDAVLGEVSNLTWTSPNPHVFAS